MSRPPIEGRRTRAAAFPGKPAREAAGSEPARATGRLRPAWPAGLPWIACACIVLGAVSTAHPASGQQRTEPRPQPPATAAAPGEPAADPIAPPVDPPDPSPFVGPPAPLPFVGPPAPPPLVGPPVPPLLVGPPVPPPFVGPPAPGIEEIAEGLYVVAGYDINVVARVTPEGVVVSGGLIRDHDVVADWIASVTDQPIRYVVGTRRRANADADGAEPLPPAWRAARIIAPERAPRIPPGGEQTPAHAPESTPGNAPGGGQAPAGFPVNAPPTRPASNAARAESPASAPRAPGGEDQSGAGRMPADPPDIAFTAQASLFLGGVEIQVHHFGPALTGADAVVLFADHGVLYAGDLVSLGAPLIDYARGGSGSGWVDALGGVLGLDFETAIPARGPPVAKAHVQALRDRLVTLRMRAMQLIRLGVPREEALARLETADLDWRLAPEGPFASRTFAAFYDEIEKERAEWTPAEVDDEPDSDVVGELARTPQSR